MTVEKLKQQPGGITYGEKRIEHYKKKGFSTPSGKIELVSDTLKSLGHDPIPVHQESPESPVTNPAMAEEYPLILTTGARILEFLHSEYRDIPKLRKKYPKATAEIHTSTARVLSVEDGEEVFLENEIDAMTITARVTEDILPGVVNVAVC